MPAAVASAASAVDLVRVVAGHLGEHVGQQRCAGDRRSVQQCGTPVGQAGEPAADHLADGCGHVGRGARSGEQLAELAGIERVAAAAFVHQPRPVVLCCRSGDGLHQVGHLVGRQALQRHEFGRAGQVGQRGGDAGWRLVRPVGADQHQRTRLGLVRHKAQQVHGGLIGRVQVVQDHHDRRARRRPGSAPARPRRTRGPGPRRQSRSRGELVASSGTIAASSGGAASARSWLRSSSARSAWVHGHHAGA